jgi:hypothetical protein
MRMGLLFWALLMLTGGCAAWKRSPWTPDTFNYTISRDRRTGEQVDYLGFGWNLKP